MKPLLELFNTFWKWLFEGLLRFELVDHLLLLFILSFESVELLTIWWLKLLSLFEYFPKQFCNMLRNHLSFYLYLVYELIISCCQAFFLTEKNVKWLLCEITLDTDRQVLSILFIELFSQFSFWLYTTLKKFAYFFDSLVLSLSS
mgnify:CR=1 FL=1